MKWAYDFHHSNGIVWHRLWWQGLGVWTQNLQTAAKNDWSPWWPSRPFIKVWSTKKRRVAILLPDRKPTIRIRLRGDGR